ncbi:prolipoprotein diacylglyceryl transferase [Calditrichota bacterium]
MEWNFDPVIIRVGPMALRWYSLMFMLAFLGGYVIMRWIYNKEKKDADRVDQLFVFMFFSTIIGARLGHCLFYNPVYYLSNPLEILMIWKGGLASHGAAVGILTGLYIYSKKNPDLKYLWIVDRIVIVVALSGFFIRMGNLFNSEIVGITTDVPWAFIFTKIDMLPRHPAQLYEAIAYLFIFGLLIAIYKKNTVKLEGGYLLGLFFLCVFGFRFFVEFFKENQAVFEKGWTLNMGQILSIPLVLIGIFLIVRAKTKPVR